jgi:hypothetical protein
MSSVRPFPAGPTGRKDNKGNSGNNDGNAGGGGQELDHAPDQDGPPPLKKSAHRYLLYLLTSYVLAERVEYREDTFASASLEICVPGGLYFRYSVFPGVMLASSMHMPESFFQTCNSFY